MENLGVYKPGELIIKGKTKEVFEVNGISELAYVLSTDDITAGDGAKHDVFAGKAAFANQTTCNVFKYLQRLDIPLAFIEQLGETAFLAEKCQMVPLEVVGRRFAWGSYLDRNRGIEKGTRFEEPKIEIFLKTKDRDWQGLALPCDDPLMIVQGKQALLYRSKLPIEKQEAIGIFDFPLRDDPEKLTECIKITRDVFLAIEKAWNELGFKFVDIKIEFGITADGRLVVADVIDNDSWRVVTKENKHLDKQFYRDGGDIKDVAVLYRNVAQLTAKFLAMA